MSDEAQWWVSRSGAAPTGPISHAELIHRVDAGETSPDDFVCQAGWPEWKTVSSILSPPAPVVPPASPPVIVERPEVCTLREKASTVLTPGERILIIAGRGLPGFGHHGIVVTTKRLIALRSGLAGLTMKFDDWHWIDVVDVHIQEHLLGTTFSVRSRSQTVELSNLHKGEAREAYRLAQELEESARTGRRSMEIEMLQAAASQVVVGR